MMVASRTFETLANFIGLHSATMQKAAINRSLYPFFYGFLLGMIEILEHFKSSVVLQTLLMRI